MSRPPEYRLKILHKKTKYKGAVGAGWINKDGSISIQLNPSTYLTNDPDLVITLFPNDRQVEEPKEQPE